MLWYQCKLGQTQEDKSQWLTWHRFWGFLYFQHRSDICRSPSEPLVVLSLGR
jgi:hypothetical protein